MNGVEAFYDHNSIMGANNIQPQAAGFMVPEELFCSGTVKFYSQPIGIIVANSQRLALNAASKVKVYYSTPETKPLLNIQDVLNNKATDRITHQTSIVASKKGEFLRLRFFFVWIKIHESLWLLCQLGRSASVGQVPK